MGFFDLFGGNKEVDEREVEIFTESVKGMSVRSLASELDSALMRVSKVAYTRLLKKKCSILNDKEFEEEYLIVYDKYIHELEEYSNVKTLALEAMFPEAERRNMSYKDQDGIIRINTSKIHDSATSLYMDRALRSSARK